MDIFEAMETQRAIRRLKPDPVPDELLQKLVHYATRAPSAGNAQLWRFIVVTDPADRKFIGDTLRGAMGPRFSAPPPSGNSPGERMARTFREFVLEFDRAPAIILTCAEDGYPPNSPDRRFVWSTVYPATQNLLLAARALGLGAAMTTFHHADEPAIREHFGIPESAGIGAVIPVGYPIGKYGPVNRKPDAEVTFWSRWGTTR